MELKIILLGLNCSLFATKSTKVSNIMLVIQPFLYKILKYLPDHIKTIKIDRTHELTVSKLSRLNAKGLFKNK